MDFLVYLIHLVAAHPFGYMAFAIILLILLAIFTKGPKNKFQRGLFVLLLLGIPLDFLFGSYINSKLIYLAGEPGKAEVISNYQTSSQYNNQNVVGYKVLIRTQEGKIIQTSFEDDDFNVYPSHNGVSYPQQGDHFNVRYLRHFPGSFIIIANDDSPWASGLQCGDWKEKLDETRGKFEFDKSDQHLRRHISALSKII